MITKQNVTGKGRASYLAKTPAALPRFAIDSIRPVETGVVLIRGWMESGELCLFIDSKEAPGTRLVDLRPDVERDHGPGTASWGFIYIFQTFEPLVLDERAQFFIRQSGELTPLPRAPLDARLNAFFGDNISERIFIDAVSRSKTGRLLELGSRARSGNVYRDLFPAAMDYVGVDLQAGPNVDVVADAHHLPADMTDSVDFIFSVSAFEHFLMPWKVVLEMNRVMKDGALAYIQSHASWPLHDQPWDFFRFSRHAWWGLFNDHTGFEVVHSNHGLKASLVPDFALGGPLVSIASESTFLLSACLVRKVGPAKVTWDANVVELAAVFASLNQ